MKNTDVRIETLLIRRCSFPFLFPFKTAQGQKTTTHNLQLRIQLSSKTIGTAEASTSIAMPEQTPQAMEFAIQRLLPYLIHQPIVHYRSIIQQCWAAESQYPTAVAAIECALLEAYTKTIQQPLYQFLGTKNQPIETDYTLSIDTPERLYANTLRMKTKGFRKFKLKLKEDRLETNLSRIQAVLRAVPNANIVIDGNQGWSLRGALQFLKKLEEHHITIHFFEQPFPKKEIDMMKAFRKKCHIPLFADESAQTSKDALLLCDNDAVDGINIKVAKCGLLDALEMIRIAKGYHKKIAIGCMEESRLGLTPSVHLACGVGAFDWIDLDSIYLLKPERTSVNYAIQGPFLSVEPL